MAQPGENSPYAAALLKHLSAGGFSFGDVMTMVTEEVYLKTKAQQLPWTNSSLRRVLSFGEPVEADEVATQAAIKGERRKLLLSIATTPPETARLCGGAGGARRRCRSMRCTACSTCSASIPGCGEASLSDQLQSGAARLKELMAENIRGRQGRRGAGAAVASSPTQAENEGAIALALQVSRRRRVRERTSCSRTSRTKSRGCKQDMVDIAATYAAQCRDGGAELRPSPRGRAVRQGL